MTRWIYPPIKKIYKRVGAEHTSIAAVNTGCNTVFFKKTHIYRITDIEHSYRLREKQRNRFNQGFLVIGKIILSLYRAVINILAAASRQHYYCGIAELSGSCKHVNVRQTVASRQIKPFKFIVYNKIATFLKSLQKTATTARIYSSRSYGTAPIFCYALTEKAKLFSAGKRQQTVVF